MRPKPAHPVQEGFDLILLNIIVSIRYTKDTFLKELLYFFLQF